MKASFRPYGVFPDRALATVPEDGWADGLNILFRNETAQAVRVTTRVWNPGPSPFVPRFIMATAPVNGAYGWLVGGFNPTSVRFELWYCNGLTTFVWTNVTPAGWAAIVADSSNKWSGCEINGRIFVAPNSTTEPAVWSSSVPTTAAVMLNTVVTWFGAGVGTRAIRSYRNHLFALGLENLGFTNYFRLCWSSGAAMGGIPATFTAAATNDAGETQFPEIGGALVDALPLGNSMAIYRVNAIHRAVYVGGLTVFSIQRLVDGIGAASSKSVAMVPGGHIFWSGESVYFLSESGELKNLCADTVARAMRAQNIIFQRREAFCEYHAPEREFWLFLPDNDVVTAGVKVNAWIYNIDSGRWSRAQWVQSGTAYIPTCVSLGRSAEHSSSHAGFEHMIIGEYQQSGTQSRFLSVDDQQHNTAASHEPPAGASLTLKARDFGEPLRRKFIRGIRLAGNFASGNDGSVKIYTRENREGAATLRQTLTWTDTTEWIPAAVEGRYFDLEFVATYDPTIAPWKLSGFDVEYELRGAW